MTLTSLSVLCFHLFNLSNPGGGQQATSQIKPNVWHRQGSRGSVTWSKGVTVALGLHAPWGSANACVVVSAPGVEPGDGTSWTRVSCSTKLLWTSGKAQGIRLSPTRSAAWWVTEPATCLTQRLEHLAQDQEKLEEEGWV